MPRASALIAASLGAASAAGGAPVCARDSALLQARAAISHSPHEGNVRVEHRMVGCFPRAASDTDDQESFQDPTCVSEVSRNSSLEPCRSGMPFFRLPMQPQRSYLDCFTFCLSKGLDLSGLVHSERAGLSECRCGATRANKAAWHGLTPPPGLLLPSGSAVPEDSERCKLLVWQYTGPLEDEAVPTVLTQLSLSDEAYIDGIAVGVDPHQITEEDVPEERIPTVHPDTLANLSLLGTKGLCEDHTRTGVGNNMPCSQAKTWCNAEGALGLTVRSACPLSCGICTEAYGWMPCYPHACSPGGGPWTTKQGNVVYINYFYENLDSGRRAAFEKAKAEWESKTCVRFTYSTATPRMRITITNYDTCSAFVGFPGSDGTLDVNLGWCNTVSHWGNVAHELGHALGMNHEQNRPDGEGQAYTPAGYKGPHLRVKWQNIDAAWRPQWEGQKRSYYGSQTAGYAAYDYESMMHYGLGDKADATNSAYQNVPGQRSGLSDGDIRQFQDMYQCGASAPAPTAAPTPSGSCTDDPDYVGPWEDRCKDWVKWEKSGKYRCADYTADAPDLLGSCPKACKACQANQPTPLPTAAPTSSPTPSPTPAPTPAPAPTPGPAPAGCVDSTENPWGQSCATWLATGACATSKGIREHCKVSCQQCSPPTPAPRPAPTLAPTQTPCTDDPGYVGPWEDRCKDWVEWERSGKYRCADYTADSPDLLGSCPKACKVCQANPPDGSCTDDPDYVGPWEDRCKDWVKWEKSGKYRCADYTADAPDLLGSCPKACKVCQANPPTPLPTAAPTSSPTPTPAPIPAPSSGCTDTQGQLPYGLTCVQWALRGDCAGSQTLQADCPGSCAEASKVTYSLTCVDWQKRGDCANSNTLKAECPHLCGQCR